MGPFPTVGRSPDSGADGGETAVAVVARKREIFWLF